MHVRNLGYPPSPYKSGATKPRFWTEGKFNGLYLRSETWCRQSVKCIDIYKGLLHRPKISWTLVNKLLKTRPAFLPSLDKFCILLHCQASQTEISKGNLTKLCQVMGSKLPYQTAVGKSEPSLPQKLGAKKLLHLFRFSTTSRLSGEYLLNTTWHRQSEKGIWNY